MISNIANHVSHNNLRSHFHWRKTRSKLCDNRYSHAMAFQTHSSGKASCEQSSTQQWRLFWLSRTDTWFDTLGLWKIAFGQVWLGAFGFVITWSVVVQTRKLLFANTRIGMWLLESIDCTLQNDNTTLTRRCAAARKSKCSKFLRLFLQQH